MSTAEWTTARPSLATLELGRKFSMADDNLSTRARRVIREEKPQCQQLRRKTTKPMNSCAMLNDLLETCFWACMNENGDAAELVGSTIGIAQDKIKAARALIDPRNVERQEGEAA